MPIDPRTPVLVGAGQVLQRADDPATAREPLELMAEAARCAAEDADSADLLRRMDTVFVPQGLWDYENPGAWLAEHLAAGKVSTGLGAISGTTVSKMITRAACDIASGARDIVLVAGGEAEHSKRRAKARGLDPRRTPQSGPAVDLHFETSFETESLDWKYAGVLNPVMAFALVETALRARRGEGVEEHRRRLGALWASFAKVAESNPFAWIRMAPSADEIATPTPTNRMVATPYTKFLVANMVVDQAAAVFLCSVETARRFGIAEDRWVYPLATTEAEVGKPLSTRESLCEEPTMRIAGTRVFELAGVSPEEIGPIDLYSCFPAAVQLAVFELGLDETRPLTLTGGLTFAGGPFNSYGLHSLATLIERLRSEPEHPGLLTAVGGLMSRHAFSVYGRTPPERGFRSEDLSAAAAALPAREFAGDYTGAVAIESAVAVYGPDGPETAVIAARTPSGARAWARGEEPDLLESIASEGLEGRAARIGPNRILEL